MSRLVQWLDHRMEVMGFNRKDFSEYSGLPDQTIQDIYICGTIDALSRSERRLFAASLRVSLRNLEQLDDGQIAWIDDKHFYDAGVQGRPLPWQEDDPAYWMPKETKPEDRGTPVIGSIRFNGEAQPDDDWQEEWDRHIPQRFGKGREIYALDLDRSGQCAVFRNIPPWEFSEGKATVYCWNGWEAQGWFGRVYLKPSHARVVTEDGARHDLDIVSVVRIGKLVGRWPQPESNSSS